MIFLNLHFIYTYCNYKDNEHFLDSINMKTSYAPRLSFIIYQLSINLRLH